jgi:hypothetical protein
LKIINVGRWPKSNNIVDFVKMTSKAFDEFFVVKYSPRRAPGAWSIAEEPHNVEIVTWCLLLKSDTKLIMGIYPRLTLILRQRIILCLAWAFAFIYVGEPLSAIKPLS